MRYSLGIDLGGTTARVAAASEDGRLHDVGEVPLVVGLTPGGEIVVGSGALTLEESRRASGFRDLLGQPEPMLLGGSPFGVEALIAQVLRSVVDTVASDVGEWPVRIAVAHPDDWGDYHLDLLWQAAAMAEVGDVVLLTDSEARTIDADELTSAFSIARGAARWSRPEDQTPPVEPAGLPISGRTAASVLAALAGGAALGVAGATATAGSAGAGAAARIADFAGGGRTMADWARGTQSMSSYGDGSRMSDFGEGRQMSDFGGGTGGQPPQQPPQPSVVQTTARVGRRIPKAAVIGTAAVVTAIAVGAAAFAVTRGGNDETDVGLTGTTVAPIETTTTVTAPPDDAPDIPFLFAGGGSGRIGSGSGGDPTSAVFGGVTGVAIADNGDTYILDRGDGSDTGRVWVVRDGSIEHLVDGDEFDGAALSNPQDIAIAGIGSDAKLVVADSDNSRLVRMSLDGTNVESIGSIGESTSELPADGSSVDQLLLATPTAVAGDAAGNIYVADLNLNAILRIAPDDTVTVVTGRGSDSPADGGTAVSARFGSLRGLALDFANSPVIAAGNQVWSIDAGGTLRLVGGTGEAPSDAADTVGAATEVKLAPVDVAVGPDGGIFVANDSPAANIVKFEAFGVTQGSPTFVNIAGGDPPAPALPPTRTRFSPDAIVVVGSDLFIGENGTSYEIVRRVPASGVSEDEATFEFDAGDEVGAGDGAIGADGAPDNTIEVTLEGEVAEILVTACPDGQPSGSQWDTFVGDEAIPDGFVYTVGSQTWVAGVARASGALINRDNGDIAVQSFDEPTRITLYLQNDGSIQPGAQLCVVTFDSSGDRSEQRLTVSDAEPGGF